VDDLPLDGENLEALLGSVEGPGSAGQTSGQDDSDSTGRLLDQAEADLAAALEPDLHPRPGMDLSDATPFKLQPFGDNHDGSADEALRLESLQDVELDVRIELGRTELLIDEVLRLKEGSVVPLDKLAGDPVDILVNGRLVARGEVLVLNDNFCVRVAEILSPDF
jgi:flagellar motor switch protein FliN/FliY